MIRRKVFSSYSEEDLISAIEERAFCEGYQAAQKEFGVDSLMAKQAYKFTGEANYGKARKAYKNLPKYLRGETGPKALMKNMNRVDGAKGTYPDTELRRLLGLD